MTARRGQKNAPSLIGLASFDGPRPATPLALALAALSRAALDIQIRAEKDRASRDYLVRLLELDSSAVEADVLVRGHEDVYLDLSAGTWPRHHSTLDTRCPELMEWAAGLDEPEPPPDIQDHPEAPRSPGVGSRLERRLRKRGR